MLQSYIVTLGERIESRRRALGLSQNELARRAGINHPTLFKIESGQRRNPSIGIVVKIARALGTTAEALVGVESDDGEATKASGSRRRRPASDAERLATGGVALIEELTALRTRVDALEAWRRSLEARSRKRAAR